MFACIPFYGVEILKIHEILDDLPNARGGRVFFKFIHCHWLMSLAAAMPQQAFPQYLNSHNRLCSLFLVHFDWNVISVRIYVDFPVD